MRLALVQIQGQKLKTFFTLFGVMLGVMFLIVVVSVVEGMNRYIERDLIGKLMTLRIREIRRFPQFQMGNVDADNLRAWERRPPLHERDTLAILAAIPAGFRHALQNDADFVVASRYARPESLAVRSVSHSYFAIKNLQISNGRPFLEQEDRLRASVAVIGDDVKEHFFPGLDAVGRTLRINGIPYQVIGVVGKQGTTFGMSLDNFILVPYDSPLKPFMTEVPGEISTIIVQGPDRDGLGYRTRVCTARRCAPFTGYVPIVRTTLRWKIRRHWISLTRLRGILSRRVSYSQQWDSSLAPSS